MNKKSKKTLENAFNIPEPNQKDSFFNKLDIKPERKFSSFIPVYLPTAIVAVMIIGLWGGIKNLPRFEQPENIDNIIYSSESSVSENYTDPKIQTSLSYVSSSEKQTQTTTAFQTNNTDTSENEKSTYVTTTSEKATENTTNKNNSNESSENSTSENSYESDSESTTESPRTTNNTTHPRRTTSTTRTTSTKRTTTTNTTREANAVTTTSTSRSTNTTATHDGGNSSLPQTTTVSNYEVDLPALITTTEHTLSVGDYEHPDYTVIPPVRYYPDDNAIDVSDSMHNDAKPPLQNGGQSPPQDVAKPGATVDFDSWQNLADNSDIIVIADVDEIIYTSIDGTPYTQENITVSKVIKGDIEQHSRISVYGKGGYIPASEHGTIQISWAIENDCMLFDPAENKTFSEVGDRYIYFIKKSDYPLPDGSYCLTTYNDMSKFRYKDGRYINMNNNNIMFTTAELYEYINH